MKKNERILEFVKYSGNGNDFIILKDVDELPGKSELTNMCDRRFGIGADGIIVLEKSDSCDGVMRVFNADGLEAEMCGNGLRCLVTYIDSISPIPKPSYKIQTMNSTYEVLRHGKSFAIEMSEISDASKYDLSEFKEFSKSFYISTGVPHLVFLTTQLDQINVKSIAPFYRHHHKFPQGTNVNFVELTPDQVQSARVRTFERGVEDETLSCGTGLTATALALKSWLGWQGDIHLYTRGGRQLVQLGEKVFFSGEVKLCFRGQVSI